MTEILKRDISASEEMTCDTAAVSNDVSDETVRRRKFASALGLAKKAGAVAAGVPLALDALRRKKAVAVIYAADVSEKTLKKLRTSCEFYNTVLVAAPLTMGEISSAIGTERLCGAAAVTDAGLFRLFEKLV